MSFSDFLKQQCFIDGQWVDADGGETLAVIDPGTGEQLGTVPKMGVAETRRAIDAAEAQQLMEFLVSPEAQAIYAQKNHEYPVLDGARLLGCITVDSLQGIQRDDWSSRKVADLMESRSASNTVDAGMDTMALLTDILKPGGRSRFMVVEDDRLVGVIALKDLLEIISLKLQIESPGRGA